MKCKEYAEIEVDRFMQALNDEELAGQAEVLYHIHGDHICPKCMESNELKVLSMQVHRLSCPRNRSRGKLVHTSTLEQMLQNSTLYRNPNESVVASVVECARCSVRWVPCQNPMPTTEDRPRAVRKGKKYTCPIEYWHHTSVSTITQRIGAAVLHMTKVGVYCYECDYMYGFEDLYEVPS
jgi:hypothetical protein